MGARGPRTTPAAIVRAKGNPGHRKKAAAENPVSAIKGQGADGAQLLPSEGVGGDGDYSGIPMPNWLSDEAKKVWKSQTPNLIKLNLLQRIDAQTFGRYCENFAAWLECKREMRASGMWYKSSSPHGTYLRSHPAFMQADRLDRACERAEGHFGLNPSDRQRLFIQRTEVPPGDLFPDNPASADGQAGDEPPSAVGYGVVH